ncbi:hypothetical protein [Desulfurivibrio sp. C05AmB]|jgi:hypothetical protein|uniref:hypothetical protein n=1 Tax=Desulfurivibrio sp. C05AmB TaxID=3374371 RepID=UPI00376EC5B4
MKRQVEMQEAMVRAHRDFIENLEKSVELVARDLEEAKEMTQICTDEWCAATEEVLDELAKLVFSISEPRWLSRDDSKKISALRHRIHDLYSRYKAVKK